MRHIRSYLVAAALCIFIPSGCGSSDDSDSWLLVTRQEVCKETECSRASGDACSRCLDVCYDAMMSGTNLDCESSCHYSCKPRDCEGSPCVASDYEFTVEGPSHPAIKQTCLQLSASGVSDSGPGIIDECHLLAQVLDPSVIIPHWQCAMRDGCPEDGSYDYPPTGTVGNEYCNAVLGRGEKCEPAVKAYLNDIEVFFRTEAIDALKTCFGEPLSTQVNACTMAWISLLE